jgi:branched-chain amino acid transport system ATP-binding protein
MSTSTSPESSQPTNETPVLETIDLTRTFGEFTAVDRVDLKVTENEIHSIIGPNGAGKTTLFNMIAGSLRPSTGSVVFRGKDITTVSEDERARRGIIRAFQITQLFPSLTTRENLILAAQSIQQDFNPVHQPDPELRERADEMFDELAIDATLQTPAEVLSHGDKKKLEIGMALLTDPDLLLLDEPTSGVSQAESNHIVELIDSITDVTILLIEHDVDIVLGISDRITVLHQGQVLEVGGPEDITGSEAVQRAYLGGE